VDTPFAATVTAAFARERDARYALGLIASSPEIQARFTLRDILGEAGDVQMVVLEATLEDPRLVTRVEMCMIGAHGTPIPAQAATAGRVAWAT